MYKLQIKKFGKILVSVIVLFLVFRRTDINYSSLEMGKLNSIYLFLSLAVFWLAESISSLRFVYIAERLGKNISLFDSIRALFVGMWFNQVLPSSIGGDVIKVGLLKRSMGFYDAVGATILSRMGGLFIMMLSFLLMYPLYISKFDLRHIDFIRILTLLSLAYVIIQILIICIAIKINSRESNSVASYKLKKAIKYFTLYNDERFVVGQLWTSIIVHFGGVFSYVLLSMGLGFDINPILVLLVVPIVFLVSIVPISFAGWGVREATSVLAFGFVDVKADVALILSLSYGLFLIAASLPGCFLYYKNCE